MSSRSGSLERIVDESDNYDASESANKGRAGGKSIGASLIAVARANLQAPSPLPPVHADGGSIDRQLRADTYNGGVELQGVDLDTKGGCRASAAGLE